MVSKRMSRFQNLQKMTERGIVLPFLLQRKKGPYKALVTTLGRMFLPHLSLHLPYDIGRRTRPKTCSY